MFNFKEHSENYAIITAENTAITYNSLYDYQKNLYNHLGKSKLIIILCENSLGSLIGYIACIINKIVPILIDKSTNEYLLKNILERYRPNYIWLPKSLNYFKSYESKYENWNYLLVSYDVEFHHNLYQELALLLTTSGSTGSNKLVRISYNNLFENTKSIVEYLKIKESDRAITTMPMAYSYGLSIVNTHLFSGACILLTDKKIFDKQFLAFFQKNAGTSLSGVPYTYSIMRKINIDKINLPTLRTLTQAGGKMSAIDSQFFADYSQKHNCKFYIMYGQTEATARISYLPFEKINDKIGSIGVAIPGGKIELYDNSENKINTSHTVGELIYCGKNVSLGYAFCLEDLSLGDINKGILHTNDMGYFDEENYFYLIGRKDRTIKILGNRISLDELEELLEKKFLYKFICLYRNNLIYIIGTVDNKSIIDYLSKLTLINKSFFRFRKVTSLPRTYNEKIDFNSINSLI